MENMKAMEHFQAILINLISNLFWLPIGAFGTFLVYYWKIRSPKRRLWRLSDPAKLTICASNSINTNTGDYVRPATGIGQVRALALVVRSLHIAYHNKLDLRYILLSSEQLQDRLENDLLLLGSAKTNQISQKLMDILAQHQPIYQEGNTISWRVFRGGKWMNDNPPCSFVGQSKNGVVISDFGYIISAQNPFNTKTQRTAIIFAGSHTYGTVAAARYFTENLQSKIKDILRDGKRNFAVLVSAQVIDGYPCSIKMEKCYAW